MNLNNMPRSTTWTYKKKRRKKKSRTLAEFQEDPNLDEETVDAGPHLITNLPTSSKNKSEMMITQKKIKDNIVQAPTVQKKNMNATSQSHVMSDVSQITCDKLEGGEFVSILQISNDEDIDKLNLLSSNTKQNKSFPQEVQNSSLQIDLPIKPLISNMSKNTAVHRGNPCEERKTSTVTSASTDKRNSRNTQQIKKFSLINIKKEPVDAVPCTLPEKNTIEHAICEKVSTSSISNQIDALEKVKSMDPVLKSKANENNIPVVMVKKEIEPKSDSTSEEKNKSDEKESDSHVTAPLSQHPPIQHIKSEVLDVTDNIPPKIISEQPKSIGLPVPIEKKCLEKKDNTNISMENKNKTTESIQKPVSAVNIKQEPADVPEKVNQTITSPVPSEKNPLPTQPPALKENRDLIDHLVSKISVKVEPICSFEAGKNSIELNSLEGVKSNDSVVYAPVSKSVKKEPIDFMTKSVIEIAIEPPIGLGQIPTTSNNDSLSCSSSNVSLNNNLIKQELIDIDSNVESSSSKPILPVQNKTHDTENTITETLVTKEKQSKSLKSHASASNIKKEPNEETSIESSITQNPNKVEAIDQNVTRSDQQHDPYSKKVSSTIKAFDSTHSIMNPPLESSKNELSTEIIPIIDLETDEVISISKKSGASTIASITLSDDEDANIVSNLQNNIKGTASLTTNNSSSSPIRKHIIDIDLTSPIKSNSSLPFEPQKQSGITFPISQPTLASKNYKVIFDNQKDKDTNNSFYKGTYEYSNLSVVDKNNAAELRSDVTSSQIEISRSCLEAVSSNHNCSEDVTVIPQLTRSEVTSTSDTKASSDLHLQSESSDALSTHLEEKIVNLKEKSNLKNIKTYKNDSLIERIKYNLEKIGLSSSRDQGDIFPIEIFPIVEEEVCAFCNIIKDLNSLEQSSKPFKEYHIARKQSFVKDIASQYESLDEIPENLKIYADDVVLDKTNYFENVSDTAYIYSSDVSSAGFHVKKNKEQEKPNVPTKEMLHEIITKLNSSVQPPALPESTTNVDSGMVKMFKKHESNVPLFEMDEDKLSNNREALPAHARQDSYPDQDQPVTVLKPAGENLFKLSNEQLRNILVHTQSHSSISPQPVTSSTENNTFSMDANNSIVFTALESTGSTSNIKAHSPDFPSVKNYKAIEPLESKNDKPTMTSNDLYDDVSDNDSNASNEFMTNECDSDSTLPYSEDMQLSDNDSSVKQISTEKSVTKKVPYTSKLEKIMERKRQNSMLQEEQIKLKKAKIISDPKLAQFCEKQREKKKITIPVINALPLESEKIMPKKKSKQSLNDDNIVKNSKQQVSKKEGLSKETTKREKTFPKKKSAPKGKEKIDDVSNLFVPDCKIVRKPIPSNKRSHTVEDEATNASVVNYGNRTINRGTFLTKASYEEPPPKVRKKASTFHQNTNKRNLSTGTMHFMTDSPEIKGFPSQHLAQSYPFNVSSHCLEKSFERKEDNVNKISEPVKIPFEEYTKRLKNMSHSNSRDPRLASTNRMTNQSYASGVPPAPNCDLWSPNNSNSSFSSERQMNFQSPLPEGVLMPPTVQLNQNHLMPSYNIPQAVPSPLPFTNFNAETQHHRPVRYQPLSEVLESNNVSQEYVQHQFSPTPVLPNPFIPPVQVKKSLPSFEEAHKSSTSGDVVAPSFRSSVSPKVHQRSHGAKPKRCLNLVPKSLKASIGSKYIDTKNLVLLVLEWNVDWLVQQQKNQSPPPIAPPSAIKQVSKIYATPEDHYNAYLPLLMLELWQRIYLSWTHMTNLILQCEIISFDPATEFSNIELETVVKEADIEEKKCPEEGTIVIMRFVSDDGGGIKFLGYVRNAHYTSMNNWKCDPKHERYITSERTQLLRLSVMCAYNAEDINMKKKVKIQMLCNVKSHLKQNDALLGVKESHLGEVIIKPEGDSVIAVVLGSRNSCHEMTVSQAVKDIVEGITLPHPLPQLTIVKALPSSDRITTLVHLVVEIKKMQHKILLCTRTKNALKEIGYNLENSDLDVIILGSKSEVHKRLRRYMLEDRATALVKEHSASELTKVSKESVQRAKSQILNKCDVILSLIQNCHNDIVAESISEDFDRSLTCIIDEANLCTEPEALIPTLYGISKLILIGDPNDPAKVCSKAAIDNNFNRSFFERSYILNAEDFT